MDTDTFYELSEAQIEAIFADLASDKRMESYTSLDWFKAGLSAAKATQLVNKPE